MSYLVIGLGLLILVNEIAIFRQRLKMPRVDEAWRDYYEKRIRILADE